MAPDERAKEGGHATLKLHLSAFFADRRGLPPPPWRIRVYVTPETDFLSFLRQSERNIKRAVTVLEPVAELPRLLNIRVPQSLLREIRAQKSHAHEARSARIRIGLAIMSEKSFQQAIRDGGLHWQRVADYISIKSIYVDFDDYPQLLTAGAEVDLGKFIFEDFYNHTGRVICRSDPVEINIEQIGAPKHDIGPVSKGKEEYFVVQTPDLVHRVANESFFRIGSDFDAVRLVSEPLKIHDGAAKTKMLRISPEYHSQYISYFLLKCSSSQELGACLRRFDENHFSWFFPAVRGLYYPVVQKNGEIPRCDSSRLDFL